MKATFQSIYPRLPVADLRASLGFYQKLFDVDPNDIMENDGFAILHKDKIGIQLVTQSLSHALAPTTIWIDVTGVTAFYESVKDNFSIEWGPEVYSYGRREFCLSDPDQNQIIFSEITNDPVSCEG